MLIDKTMCVFIDETQHSYNIMRCVEKITPVIQIRPLITIENKAAPRNEKIGTSKINRGIGKSIRYWV